MAIPRRAIFAATLIAFAGALAWSQDPRGGSGGFRPPGFGPPGFAPPGAEQATPSRAALLHSPEVVRELDLTVRQQDKLRELFEQRPELVRSGSEFGPPNFGPPGFGPPGFGPPGFGGPGGPPGGEERKIVAEFDRNSDGWLNSDERQAARQKLAAEPRRGRGGGPGGRGGPPGFGPPGFGPPGSGPPGFGPPGGREEPGSPGPKVAVADVAPVAGEELYDPSVLRTLFLDFESDDWETELEEFHDTDVEVPATLTVDGKKYANVGVSFRGNSSYMMVPRGSKRSFNLSLDLADGKQRLYGYKNLNLLNAHEDASFLHTALYSHIARQYIPAPKANLVRVVVNGESWGLYANAQQFDKTFLDENYASSKGTRWKVRGSPGGGGGLEYSGDNPEPYKRHFEIKSADSDKAWRELIRLCKVLNQTQAEELEKALEPLLDIEGALWFLALDNALINGDGYWTRASDYSLFRDDTGKFHVVPHDMNEAFQPPMGPGMGPPGGGPPGGPPGGPRGFPERGADPFSPPGRGPPSTGQKGKGPPGPGNGPPRGPGGGMRLDLDPLIGLDDETKPLRSRLLAVPKFRERYLQHVRTIAEKSLDWNSLGPVVEQYTRLIEKEIAADTRKLSSLEAFEQATAIGPAAGPPPRGRPTLSLWTFATERRKALLENPEIKNLPRGE